MAGAADSGAISETVMFLRYFEDLPDPRQRAKVVYPLGGGAAASSPWSRPRPSQGGGQVQRDRRHSQARANAGSPALEMLAIEGAVVTIDAMGCQRDIAQKILDKKADYVLALKANQGTLRADVGLFAAGQRLSPPQTESRRLGRSIPRSLIAA